MFADSGVESVGGGLGPWMALPLFNREASPDESRDVLTWHEPEKIQMDNVLMSDYDTGYFVYSEPSTASPGSPIGFHFPDEPYASLSDISYCSTVTTPSMSVPVMNTTDLTAGSCHDQTFDDDYDIDDAASTCSHLDLPPDLIPDHGSLCSGESSPAKPSPTSCPYPGCKSTAHFSTPRDFRRHYRQHFKRFFCRHEECPQSVKDPENAGKRGFATRKDRARHEAKHNPEIKCQWKGRNGETCSRVFSRMDNMRDHVRRIHGRKL